MDAFESLIAMLLRRDGYWTAANVKVELTKEEKRKIAIPTSPRWELDVVAYRGATNELLAVECKSYLDSGGVDFRNGNFMTPRRYKLFTNETVRGTVLERLKTQMVESGAVRKNPKVQLCLAAGHIATKCDRAAMNRLFDDNRWKLFDKTWILAHLDKAARGGYENDVAHVVAKLIKRNDANAFEDSGET